MTEIKLLFPERLRRARHLRGLTLTALAERAGMTAPSISAYERGTKDPCLSYAVALAEALQVPVSWLFAYETERENTGAEKMPWEE